VTDRTGSPEKTQPWRILADLDSHSERSEQIPSPEKKTFSAKIFGKWANGLKARITGKGGSIRRMISAGCRRGAKNPGKSIHFRIFR
jgi:hypothetical protein